MPDQLSLPGFDTTERLFIPEAVADPYRRLQKYALFLAIVPNPEDATRLAVAATQIRHHHGLTENPLPPERLHITLHELGDFRETIPQAGVDAAIAASASVVCAPMPVVFDHALSFPGSNALALLCTHSSAKAVARLRQPLAAALRRAGLHPKPSSTPHMTLLYDAQHVARHPIEPVSWTATRFALILSHVGLGHHQRIAEWPLNERV